MIAVTSSPVRPRVAARSTVPSRPAAAARTRSARTRLTRRGRALVVLVLAALVLGAFSLGRSASRAEAGAEAAAGAGTAAPVAVRVRPGESLWTLARRIAPDNDARDVVAQIRRLNGLTSSGLQVGQVLLLPVRT